MYPVASFTKLPSFDLADTGHIGGICAVGWARAPASQLPVAQQGLTGLPGHHDLNTIK